MTPEKPPRRLVLAWQITAEWSFDPTFVTEIEVVFRDAGPKLTEVEFEHRNLERYGEPASAIRSQLDDPKGWHGNLARYASVTAQKAVVFYKPAPDVLSTAPLHFPAHKRRLDAFHERGELLAVGVFGDPREGSMAVFASREAAEEFVREDPSVLQKVVVEAAIKDWNEVLM